MFLKIVRQYSRGELVSFDWLCHQIGWPFSPPDTILDLVQLESVHDVLDLYLWLSYRFQDMFPDVELVKSVRAELDIVVEEGVVDIVQLLRNAESGSSSSAAKSIIDEDAFEAKNRKIRQYKEWVHSKNTDLGDLQSDERDAEQEVEGGSGDHAKNSSAESLTDRLVSQGLLTKGMMAQLKREWLDKERARGKKKKKPS